MLETAADTHTGTCFCGSIVVEATGAPVEMGYCHCSSCRAYSGAPLVDFTLWHDADVRVVRGAALMVGFNRSGTSDRRFCSCCGSHLLTYHPGFGFTDIRAAVLPSVAFRPEVHLNYAEAVLPIRDGLPKLRDFPAHAGGSGEFMPE
jgi:hypothetical protein